MKMWKDLTYEEKNGLIAVEIFGWERLEKKEFFDHRMLFFQAIERTHDLGVIGLPLIGNGIDIRLLDIQEFFINRFCNQL